MKKTILLLLMFTIITGNLLTACGPEVVDPNAQDDQVQVTDDLDVSGDVEVMDSDAGEKQQDDKDREMDEKKVEPKKDEVKVEDKSVVQQPKVEEPKVEPPKQEEPKIEQPKESEIKVFEPPKDPEPVTLFIDGSYSQTGSYQSPAGPETIKVNLTVKDDVITGLEVIPNASHPTSQQFQNLFVTGISGQVIGKKLDELGGFSQVNGSSLTPTAFNQALASIKAEAKR